MTLARLCLCVCLSLTVTAAAAHAQTADDLFQPGQLHDVHIRMNSRDLQQLRAGFMLNTFYPADLQWGAVVVRNVALRSRGSGSRNGTKLGLLVDTNRFVSGQTFLGLSSLVLDNLTQDPSMVREHAAMALFERMGIAAPRSGFARLFVNNEYQGVYQLLEQPDERFAAHRYGPAAGQLYEYHYLEPYYLEDLGDNLAAYAARFEARNADRLDPASLYLPLRELFRHYDDESLADWRARIETSLDLPQLVSTVAVEVYLSELDGITGYAGTNNFYLHRLADTSQHVVVPWDRDNAFQSPDSPIYQRVLENIFVRQALAFPDLHALYLQRLEECAAITATNGWLENLFASSAALIAEAAAADVRAPFSPEERAASFEALLDFARRRPGIVTVQVQQARAGVLLP